MRGVVPVAPFELAKLLYHLRSMTVSSKVGLKASARPFDEMESLQFLALRLSEGETKMPDVEITCAECGTAFPFTEREQEYYTERNLSQPKRCKPCRDSRRANFGGGGRGGGGGERQRFEITCDQCGKTDSVPFKPLSGRPVLCGECFSASRAQ